MPSVKTIRVGDIVVCKTNRGRLLENGGKVSPFETHFPKNSLGEVRVIDEINVHLYVIGESAEYLITSDDIEYIDPTKTGKGYEKKICNICPVVKLHSDFEPNQRDSKGKLTTRPSCRICRRDIDKKPMTTAMRKRAEKYKPQKGTLWKCPICRKQSIVGVTAKIVLDHRHSDGISRAFLCDSCNTGLGRFKNGENYLQNATSYLMQFEKNP